MFRAEGYSPLQRGLPERRRLLRQAEHQVEVEIVKPGGASRIQGAFGLPSSMEAVECDQQAIVKGLNADAQAVEPGFPHGGELGGVRGAGVGFAGDLRIGQYIETGADRSQQPRQLGRAQKSRRSSPEKEGRDHGRRPLKLPCGALDVPAERLDGLPDNGALGLLHIGIEVAVGTVLGAEGDMQIDSKRAGGSHAKLSLSAEIPWLEPEKERGFR